MLLKNSSSCQNEMSGERIKMRALQKMMAGQQMKKIYKLVA